MRRSRVDADRTAINELRGIVDVSGRFGEAEKNTRGRIRRVAIAADESDNTLNERDRPDFVLIGWGGILREVYNERVDDDVNAKAITVVPSQRPSLSHTGLAPKDPLPCA